MIPIIVLILFFTLQHARLGDAVDVVVDVGYTRYRGVVGGQGVTSWKGMRYARRPIGQYRFAAPSDPLPDGRILDANNFGPICINSGTDLKTEFGGPESEDCLFVNVYAPTGAKATDKLPVYVFIQGGGFNGNSNSNHDGTSMIVAADMKAVVVNFNYRVGAYGFLATPEMTTDASYATNVGLLDQRHVLKWVQKNIAKFGGDPGHVTLGGASAGAGSVVLQLTAYGGRNDNLFQAVAAESQAFPPLRTVQESQFMFEGLAKNAGCTQATAFARLVCLRNLPAIEFQKAHRASTQAFPGNTQKPIWMWGPTLDKNFITDYTYNNFANGKFVKVPGIFGDSTNEGTVFTPRGLASQADADAFIKAQWPGFTTAAFDSIHTAFKQGPQYSGTGAWWSYAADLFGATRYLCPGNFILNSMYKAGVTEVYNYRWDVQSTENQQNGNGATHVGELGAVWYGGGGSAADVQKHFVSFIRSYNPNTLSGGRPNWAPWGGVNGNNRVLYSNTGTRMEKVDQATVNKCNVLWGLNNSVRTQKI